MNYSNYVSTLSGASILQLTHFERIPPTLACQFHITISRHSIRQRTIKKEHPFIKLYISLCTWYSFDGYTSAPTPFRHRSNILSPQIIPAICLSTPLHFIYASSISVWNHTHQNQPRAKGERTPAAGRTTYNAQDMHGGCHVRCRLPNRTQPRDVRDLWRTNCWVITVINRAHNCRA